MNFESSDFEQFQINDQKDSLKQLKIDGTPKMRNNQKVFSPIESSFSYPFDDENIEKKKKMGLMQKVFKIG